MKIAVLGMRGFPGVQGGVETHCENLYPRLAAKGYEVIVFTRAQYVDPAIKEFKGVKFIPLTCPKNKFLEAFIHTFKGIFAAKKIKADIVHIHAAGPSLFVPMSRLWGMKVVMTNHGPDYMRQKWNTVAKAILRLGERLGSRYANAVICISETIAENIRNKYKREVIVIPNGVVIPEILTSDEALGRFNLKKGKYILAVGRFVPEKGFDDLIRAFEIASGGNTGPRNDEWKLVIAGRADHEDKYSRELKELAGKNKDIILTGFLTGKPLQEFYSHAGLFVLPSYYEGLPIVLLEAMSYGLSCIISDIPANREVGLAEERYFNPGDIKGLAAKIKVFINRPFSEAERLSQIRHLTEKYDWNKIAEETLKVYQEIK